MAFAKILLPFFFLLHIDKTPWAHMAPQYPFGGGAFVYQDVNGILGGAFYFNKSIENNPVILWTFKGDIIARYFPGGSPVCVGQYAARCTLYENGTLILNNLTFANEGNYIMTAELLDGAPILRSNYRLRIYTVLGAPTLRSYGMSNSPISGTFVSLYCNTGSRNVTTYTFYRDGKNICSEPHVTCLDSKLHFHPITKSDSGNYTCTIQNPVSSNTSNTLQISVSDKTPLAHTAPQYPFGGGASVYQGDNGILGGAFYFNKSVGNNPVIYWTFKSSIIARYFPGGSPVCVDQYAARCTLYENGTLILNNLTFADEGSYMMIAKLLNGALTMRSNYRLRIYTVLGTPALRSNGTSNSLISGTYVSLYCDTGSLNVTTYTFYRDGKNICSEPHVTCWGSYLYFQPITESDSGNYTCTIQNPVSSNTSNTLHLSVSALISTVTLTGNTSGSYIWVGKESVSLHCSADGSDVTFLWKLNGEPLPQDSRYQISQGDSPPHTILLISPVSRSDSGLFICEAHNPVSIRNSSALSLNLAWGPEGTISCTAVPISKNVELGCSWPGGHPAANLSLIFKGVSDNGLNSVNRVVSTSGNFPGPNLTCFGYQLGRTSQCSLIFAPSPCPISHVSHGLDGYEVAEIVIEVVAGITLIELVVFLFLKKRKEPPPCTKNGKSNVSPLNIYSITIPGNEKFIQNRAMYSNLEPSMGKQ